MPLYVIQQNDVIFDSEKWDKSVIKERVRLTVTGVQSAKQKLV